MERLCLVIWALCAIAAGTVYGQSEKSIVVAGDHDKSVAVGVIIKPEYVSVPVVINSLQKEYALQLEEISNARQMLIDAAEIHPRIQVHKGPVHLSAGDSKQSSYYSEYSSNATVQLYIPLTDKERDIFKSASEITKFIKGLEPTGKANYDLFSRKLGIGNPDRYKEQLMQLIHQDIIRIKDAIKTSCKITLSGLEGPVLVRQIDDTQLEVFLDYKLSMEFEKE